MGFTPEICTVRCGLQTSPNFDSQSGKFHLCDWSLPSTKPLYSLSDRLKCIKCAIIWWFWMKDAIVNYELDFKWAVGKVRSYLKAGVKLYRTLNKGSLGSILHKDSICIKQWALYEDSRLHFHIAYKQNFSHLFLKWKQKRSLYNF